MPSNGNGRISLVSQVNEPSSTAQLAMAALMSSELTISLSTGVLTSTTTGNLHLSPKVLHTYHLKTQKLEKSTRSLINLRRDRRFFCQTILRRLLSKSIVMNHTTTTTTSGSIGESFRINSRKTLTTSGDLM